MTDLVSTDRSFSSSQQKRLKVLADLMIPAEDQLPGAADEVIFSRALTSLAVHLDPVSQALSELEGWAEDLHQRSFVELDANAQLEFVSRLKNENPAFIQMLQGSVLASYYQDDRVLQAIGLPARAPFPVGHEVAATDWSLLDPVRERAPFYRDDE